MQTVEEKKQNTGALRLLRTFGAATLLVSAGTFLLREWDVLGLPFYVQLLITTTLLGAAGLGCAWALKEPKGARTFFSLSLYLVPVNFAALGGILYSAHQGEIVDVMFGNAGALSALIASLIILTPLTLFTMRILARTHFRSLSAAFLLSCSTLLFPVRDVAWVGAILFVGFVGLSVYDRIRASDVPTLRTWEGGLARLAGFVPLVILFGRTGMYYLSELNAEFAFAIFAAGACMIWNADYYLKRPYSRLQLLAVIPGIVACMLLTWILGVDMNYTVMVVTLISGAMLAGMTFFAKAQSDWFGFATTIVLCLGMALSLILDQGLIVVGAALVTGVVVASVGYKTCSGLAFGLGSLLSTASITTLLFLLVEFQHLSHWAIFASVGALMIILASVIERHYTKLSGLARAAVGRFRPVTEQSVGST